MAPSLGTDHTLDLAGGRGSPLNKLPSCFAQAQKTVDATIIDFTLSRATLPGRVGTVAGGFEDEALFDGSGQSLRQSMQRVSLSYLRRQATINSIATDS